MYTLRPRLRPSMAALIVFLCISLFSSLQHVSSTALCSLDSNSFLFGLQSQCPLSISPNPPLQVTGNFLEEALTKRHKSGYTVVLFYASWCPFSLDIYPKIEALSSMFPEIEHLTVEQSLATPSIFSLYGIHSFPSLLMLNQTFRARYHGPKDLLSLIQFYEKTTGLHPVQYLDPKSPSTTSSSPKETSKIVIEPYLVASLLFLWFRIILTVIPTVLTRARSFWLSHAPHLNLGILREATQIVARVGHGVDVSGFWTKLRLCKTRNLREGARNARVWATSLTSVSLGEARSSH